MLFDEKTLLKKNTRYCIRALILGSPSIRGLCGFCSVQLELSGVTFTFMDSEYSDNGTIVNEGQFVELLFSL